MRGLAEIEQQLPDEYLNGIKDELRAKITDITLATQVLREAGVHLAHVGELKGTYTLWGSGVDRAVQQGVLKKVLERARKALSGGMDSGSPDATCLATLISQYNHRVIVATAGGGQDLARQLAKLDQQDEPRRLRETAVKIRDAVSQIRQRLDDEEQFKILPLQPGEYAGPSPSQRRERLARKCYQVIVAADQVARLCRILSDDDSDDNDEETEDEGWDPVAVDPVVQMMREQYAHRELGPAKLRLAARVRRLLRNFRAIPLESGSDTLEGGSGALESGSET
jgi:hypothetical protein